MLPFGINELPHFQAEDPLQTKFSDREGQVAYLALADNVPRPPSNCPNGMNQPSISPRIRFFGASCNPGDRSQAHQSCLVSRSSPHPLFTPPAAAAMVAPETSALLAASTRGRSIQRPSLAYTAATTSPT